MFYQSCTHICVFKSRTVDFNTLYTESKGRTPLRNGAKIEKIFKDGSTSYFPLDKHPALIWRNMVVLNLQMMEF